MTRRLRTALLITCSALFSVPRAAFALQQLLPTPYPSGLGSTAESIPSGVPQGQHQHLIPDAAPRTYGMNAQGNPHPVHYARHQHLLRTPYPRQFR